MTLPMPTNHDSDLVKWAWAALQPQFEVGRAYKKIGVMANDLIDVSATQTSLFVPQERHRRRRAAMDAVHAVNQRYGRGTMYVAACGSPAELPMRRDLHSPRYTTRPTDIPEALAT